MSERWIVWRVRKNPRKSGFRSVLSMEESFASRIYPTIKIESSEFDPHKDKQIFCGYGGGDRPLLWTYVTSDRRIVGFTSKEEAIAQFNAIARKPFITGVIGNVHLYDFGIDLHPEDRSDE